MVVTNCLGCFGAFNVEVATIPDVPFCGSGCGTGNLLRVCAKNASYFSGITTNTPCGSEATFADTFDDCAGDKKYVCALK
jgi:hypothetical protein